MAAAKLHADDTPKPVLEPGRGRTRRAASGSTSATTAPQAPTIPRPPYTATAPTAWASGPGAPGAVHRRAAGRRLRGLNRAPPQEPDRRGGLLGPPRRKIYDVHAATASPIAEAALQRIAALYEIEDRARSRPPDERRRLRQAEASPRLAEPHAWLDQQRTRLPSSSKLAGALRYSLKRWPALTRYADDGRLEIDNNAAERALRSVAVGRKRNRSRRPVGQVGASQTAAGGQASSSDAPAPLRASNRRAWPGRAVQAFRRAAPRRRPPFGPGPRDIAERLDIVPA